MLFMGLISCAVWQTAVMRACAAESADVVKRLYKWSSLGFVMRCVLPQFLGICALTYFYQNPELRGQFFAGDGLQGFFAFFVYFGAFVLQSISYSFYFRIELKELSHR